MIVPAWLIALILFILWRYGTQTIALIKRWIRIRELVNQLPGPPTVPILGNAYNLKWDAVEFSFQMEYWFRKYAYINEGLVRFWVGPVPHVFLTRAETVKAVLENTKLLWKPPEYSMLKSILGDGLVTSSGKKWHTRRRMLTPAFHFKILQSYLTVFNAQAKTLVSILESHYEKSSQVDFLPVLRRFSMDTIAETAMGVLINAQKGENDDFYIAITRIFELLFKNLRYPWLWVKPIWYAFGYGSEYDKHVAVVKNMVRKVIDERTRERDKLEVAPTFEELSNKRKKLAFLDLLLSIKNEQRLSDDDIMEEVGTFMVAGYDTVSSSTGFVLWLLGHRQEIQDKVYDELCSIFDGSDRDITVDDLKEMRYLEQCMKETIRFYPTVVMFARRITEDIEICGHTIPAGVTAFISPFAVARDPEQWDNPEEFDPDHFSPENVAKRNPFSFLPFSAGPRNCLGQKFAIMEEKVALASVLRKYRVISLISEEENRALPEVSLKPSRGFPMRLERRVRYQ